MLTDFGIAKGLDPSGEDLTSDNVMMGTAKYLSPEQVRGRRLDGRADLYSLGLVLYECLAGRVPFLGETDADTALARLQRDPTDLARLRPTVPRGLVNLIHRLLARNPNHRPATGVGAPRRAPAGGRRTTPRGRRHAAVGTARADVGSAGPGRPRRQDPAGRAEHPGRGDPSNPVEPRRARDHTPHAGPDLRGSPARGLQSRTAPSLIVVCGLLLVALIVALVLWATIGRPADGQGSPTTVPAATVRPQPPGPVEIATIAAYDPQGDGEENDELAAAAAGDDDPATNWRTLCYASRYMGKEGVGLALSLTRAGTGTLTFDVGNAPTRSMSSPPRRERCRRRSPTGVRRSVSGPSPSSPAR